MHAFRPGLVGASAGCHPGRLDHTVGEGVLPALRLWRPDLVTAAWWKEERGTRVFIDFNQNAPHKTIFGA